MESLIAHPATMTHASMDAEARAAAGIRDSLVRLSVGIEAPKDLVRDVREALDEVSRALNLASPSPRIAVGVTRDREAPERRPARRRFDRA